MTFPIDDSALDNFRRKYSGVHPLVFQRSLERAKSALELFEILESMPAEPPYSWNDESRCWARDDDVMGLKAMRSMGKRGS